MAEKCDSCKSSDGCADSRKQDYEKNLELKLKMSKIKHKIAVISGKGGVGKSTVTVNLAMAFATHGYVNSVGILDADITGPCIPKILGIKGQKLQAGPPGIFPATGPLGIKVVSMDFLLPSDEAPVIWRGPLGTGDEPLSVMQLLPSMDGVVIVTIPSEVSQIVVKKAVTFARKLNIPVIGIIENMSGFVCPKCGEKVDIFKAGGGRKIAEDLVIPFLGKIPIDPEICDDSDKGVPFIIENPNSPASKAFMEIVGKVEEFLKQKANVEKALAVDSEEVNK